VQSDTLYHTADLLVDHQECPITMIYRQSAFIPENLDFPKDEIYTMNDNIGLDDIHLYGAEFPFGQVL